MMVAATDKRMIKREKVRCGLKMIRDAMKVEIFKWLISCSKNNRCNPIGEVFLLFKVELGNGSHKCCYF